MPEASNHALQLAGGAVAWMPTAGLWCCHPFIGSEPIAHHWKRFGSNDLPIDNDIRMIESLCGLAAAETKAVHLLMPIRTMRCQRCAKAVETRKRYGLAI